MISSKYNIWLESDENDGKLCFNCKTGGFAEFDKHSYDLFKKATSDGFDESKLSEDDKKTFHEFIRGHLISESKQKDADIMSDAFIYKMSTTRPPIKGLTILPTLDCNCKCDYCYQGEKKRIAMSNEVAECIKKDVDAGIEKDHIKTLSVMWFGGEPLLEFDRIVELSEYFIKKTSENDVSYHADIISNCVLLTKEKAKKLKELKVGSVQCTLDGPRRKHDKTRILHDDSPTFDTIIQNIIDASEFIPISVRLNISKEFMEEGIDELIEDLKPLKGLRNIGFYPAMVSSDNTSACQSVEAKCYSVAEFSKIYVEVYEAFYKNGFPMNWRAKPNNGGCGATNATGKVVQPDGNLCRCWSQVGADGESYGNIKNLSETFDPDNYYKWMLYNPYQDEECNECKFFPLCRRGCPANHVPASTDFMKPASERGKICTMSKYNIKSMLKLLYKFYKRQQELRAKAEEEKKSA